MSDNSPTAVGYRPNCPALRHDTSSAYKKDRCRCPAARRAEVARKRKYDATRDRSSAKRAAQLAPHVVAACPPFHADPRRNCADLLNPDVMFPDKKEDIAKAQAVCDDCPFKTECAQWALETRQIYGVYGGISQGERRRQIADLRQEVAA